MHSARGSRLARGRPDWAARERSPPDVSRLPFKIAVRIGLVSICAAMCAGVVTFFQLQKAQSSALWAQSHREADDYIRHAGQTSATPADVLQGLLQQNGLDAARAYDGQGQAIAQHIAQNADLLKSSVIPAREDLRKMPAIRIDRLPGSNYLLRMYFPAHSEIGEPRGQPAMIEVMKVLNEADVAPLRHQALISAAAAALLCLAVGAAIYPFVRMLLKRSTDLLEQTEGAYLELIHALGATIALRDAVTSNHCYRATLVAIRLGQAVGLSRADMRALIAGSLVHDVGKIAVDEAILRKAGPLDGAEISVMRRHVAEGLKIVGEMAAVPKAVDVVAFHHERWDGGGYPYGLAGLRIPLVARIFAIADVFDSLCAARPYKPALEYAEVMSTMQAGSGTHFDPGLLALFTPLSAMIYRRIELNSSIDLVSETEACLRTYFCNDAKSAVRIYEPNLVPVQ